MNSLIETVLSLSLSGSLVILFLFFLKSLLKNRTSKRWQYYIWLIALLRLLLPLTPGISPVGVLFHSLEQNISQADVFFIEENEAVRLQEENGYPEAPLSGTRPWDSSSVSGGIISFMSVFPLLLWFLWLVLFVRKVTIYQSFIRYVKAGSSEVSDVAVLDRLASAAEQAGVNKPVELYCNPLVSTPLLIGFVRPCIILPTIDLPDSDFQYTALHELTHYKRGDMFYKWFVQLVVCLHWFNPLVYLMEQDISRLCELSCDEAVIRKLDAAGQHGYGDTLINAISVGGHYKNSLASVTLNESKELLKERLEAIMNFNKRKKLMIPVALSATLLLCSCASAAGAYLPFNDDLEKIEAVMYGLSDSDTKTAAAQKEIRLKGNEQGPPAVLDKDSSGLLEISFRIDTLSPHSEVCIGAVPDLGSAKKVLYEVRTAHGKNLYMGIRMPKNGNLIVWSSYQEGRSQMHYESEDGIYHSPDYSGNYYIYVGSQKNKLTDISGTVRIQYEAGPSSQQPEPAEGSSYMENYISMMGLNNCQVRGTAHQEANSPVLQLTSLSAKKDTEITITGTLKNQSGYAKLVYTAEDGEQTIIADGNDGAFSTAVVIKKGIGVIHFTGDNIICDFDLDIKNTDLLHCSFLSVY